MFENDADFEKRKKKDIVAMAADPEFRALAQEWFVRSVRHRYSYNFRWLGMPIIQYPADIMAMQELIWRIRPRAVLETGIARGGGLIFYASILELIGNNGVVVGVDVALGAENRAFILEHQLGSRISLVDGDSKAPATVQKAKDVIGTRSPVLVILDSLHTHEHVLEELRAYSPLVGLDSYVVVCDTVVDELPLDVMADRPWRPGNSPNSAVRAFLAENSRFEIDTTFDDRLVLSVCRGGFLRCIAD